MLKCFLDEYEIRYEASECYDDIHFEIACDEVERDAIEEFFITELDWADNNWIAQQAGVNNPPIFFAQV